jgi:hypothetical protein
MEGFVVVAKKPDGSIEIFGISEGEPYRDKAGPEAVAADPSERLEPGWECTVQQVQGIPE